MLITLWNVKEPTNLSQRLVHGVPSEVVCPLSCIMVKRVNGQRYELHMHQAALKSEGK